MVAREERTPGALYIDVSYSNFGYLCAVKATCKTLSDPIEMYNLLIYVFPSFFIFIFNGVFSFVCVNFILIYVVGCRLSVSVFCFVLFVYFALRGVKFFACRFLLIYVLSLV